MDPDDYKPGLAEDFVSSPASAIGVTALAAGFAAATPIAIFLPSLAGCWVGVKQQARMKEFIQTVSLCLNEHSDMLNQISETQYQMISEAVVSALHTLDKKKLDMLRYWIANSFHVDVEPEQSAFIARAIRDISPEEAEFLSRLDHKPIITSVHDRDDAKYNFVDPESKDYLSMVGLVSLGLLRDQSGFGSITVRTSYADVVCRLISEP